MAPLYDGAMSTKHPDDPSEDDPSGVAAGAPDTSPASAAAQPHDALFRQSFGDPVHAAAGPEDTMLTFEQLLRKEEFQKGVEKGLRELLLGQLTERFGSLPEGVTQRVARAGLQELERWGRRILKATSLDDVFAAS